ncbi:F-box protein-like protein [Tanacetum coccineum]
MNEDEEEEDRISLLPDCLIIEIISHLPTTKEAIKTSALSKRWQYLWTHVPNLTFLKRHVDNHSISDFFSFVDQILTQCRQSNLIRFCLQTAYDIQFESQVNNCIRYAVNRNVHDLSLSYAMDQYEYDEARCNEAEVEMFKGLLLSLRHVKELEIGIACSKVFSCLEAKGFVFPSNLKVGDWYEYDSDSDETGDLEELLLDDGHESEGDEAN